MTIRTDPLAERLRAEFARARARTDRVFGLLRPEAYYERPIALRHPFVFYEGHLEAFAAVTLLQRSLGQESFDEGLDRLFERGIDPSDEAAAARHARDRWPDREGVLAYRDEVRRRVDRFLDEPDFGRSPLLHRGAQAFLVLEHELMHHETLLYMIQQLPDHLKVPPQGMGEPDRGPAPAPRQVEIPAGTAWLGAGDEEFEFGWDNEFPLTRVEVPGFAVDAFNVTNGQFLAFIDAGGYQDRRWWTDATWAWKEAQGVRHPHAWRDSGGRWRGRGLFGEEPLVNSWPVLVTHAEASAYARWAGGALPTEAEWHRAAMGEGRDPYPWGEAAPTAEHGNFDFGLWGPTRVGAHPAGASRWGVHDLVGNGWEWTSTPFAPFPGFAASPGYPQYSQDFFDGQHMIMKGGAWFTDGRFLRRSFRNWFYWHYPYMAATFRCVRR